MGRFASSLLGLAISALLLGVLATQINLAEMGGVLAQSRPYVLPVALGGLAVDLTARTVRWRVLLARAPRPGYRATFRYLVVGYLANNVLPARVGELIRAHLLGSREAVGTSRALGSIALERGLDVVSAAVLGLGGIVLLGIDGPLQAGFTVLTGLALFGLLVLMVAPHGWIRLMVDGVVERVSHRPLALVMPKVAAFVHGLLDAASPRTIWPGLALSFLAWLATAGVFFIAGEALGLHLSLTAVLVIAMAANLGTALPSAPAGIGPFEFAVVAVGTAAGLDASSALLLGLLSHLLTVVPVCLLGAGSLAVMGLGPRSFEAMELADGQPARAH